MLMGVTRDMVCEVFTVSKRSTIWKYPGNSNVTHSSGSDEPPTSPAFAHVKRVYVEMSSFP